MHNAARQDHVLLAGTWGLQSCPPSRTLDLRVAFELWGIAGRAAALRRMPEPAAHPDQHSASEASSGSLRRANAEAGAELQTIMAGRHLQASALPAHCFCFHLGIDMRAVVKRAVVKCRFSPSC